MSSADSLVLRQLLQRFIRDFGLLSQNETPCGKPLATSHAHALMVLLESSRRGEEPTQNELARELGIDKSNAARLCQRMESEGHLARARGAEDARVRSLTLTAAGQRVANEIETASRARFAALYAGIPAAQRTKVLQSLQLLTEAIARLDDSG